MCSQVFLCFFPINCQVHPLVHMFSGIYMGCQVFPCMFVSLDTTSNFQMIPDISRCFQAFSFLFMQLHRFPGTLFCHVFPSVYIYVSRCFHLLPCVSRHYMFFPRYFQVFPCIYRGFQLLPGSSLHFQLFPVFTGSSSICWNSFQMFPSILSFFPDIFRCFQAFPGF